MSNNRLILLDPEDVSKPRLLKLLRTVFQTEKYDRMRKFELVQACRDAGIKTWAPLDQVLNAGLRKELVNRDPNLEDEVRRAPRSDLLRLFETLIMQDGLHHDSGSVVQSSSGEPDVRLSLSDSGETLNSDTEQGIEGHQLGQQIDTPSTEHNSVFYNDGVNNCPVDFGSPNHDNGSQDSTDVANTGLRTTVQRVHVARNMSTWRIVTFTACAAIVALKTFAILKLGDGGVDNETYVIEF